ncbi:unnamed protein product [Acanthoscelides obtectus]|uniref:Uncharacterized protein n=1 Tax=Acanthoscelides obtectus TaxID=200917 RepID=A0A9P0P7A0_ACAOB|nr:unnamed protein product [Acanthoscelides obtectus]CAK1647625.1 hypothetical protein AOBTE_LOCUS15305 [Acanthoscelides obtectus]
MEEMKRVLKETVDRLFQEMNGRFVRLNEIDEKFGFLLDLKGLIYDEKDYDLKKKCNELGQFYVSDIDGNELDE